MRQYNLFSKCLNIDIWLDLSYKPNIETLAKYFTFTPYITSDGVVRDTSYINDTGVPMINRLLSITKASKISYKTQRGE